MSRISIDPPLPIREYAILFGVLLLAFGAFFCAGLESVVRTVEIREKEQLANCLVGNVLRRDTYECEKLALRIIREANAAELAR